MIHAERDIGRLTVHRLNDGACVAVEAELCAVIADPADGFACDGLSVDVRG